MADAESASKPVEDRIAALEEQIAKLEPLLEQQQMVAQVSVVFVDYVQDLRDEQAFLKTARYVLSAFTLVFAFLLVALLALAIFDSGSPLLRAPPTSIAIFVIGIVSGVTLLLLGLAKGVFRPAAERHTESLLPPPLEATLQLYDRIKGGN